VGAGVLGPDGSRPSAHLDENAVYRTGACGASIERGPEDGAPPGRLLGNAFVRTGQNPRYDDGEPYCPQRPIARTRVPSGFRVEGNLVHDARQPGEAPLEPELDREAFRQAVAPLLERLRAQPATARSRFVADLAAAPVASSAVPAVASDGASPGALIIVVRHAEAARDPDGDPALTGAGLERAERLATLLRDAGIDTIHSTDRRRTRATAAPLAALLGLEPSVYDGRGLETFAERLLQARGRHLVVGHSNTNPQLVRLLGGDPGPDIRDDEHDRVYLLVLDGASDRAPRTVVVRY
jgi:phosphohistidine phosphatase SixA